MNVFKVIGHLFIFLLASSCVFKADEVKLKGFDVTRARGGNTEEVIEVEVTAVTLEDDQLKISGTNLDSVTGISLGSDTLSIVSQTASELILSSSTALNIALNTAMDLVLTNAYGQSVTSVQFNLVDGAVTAAKLADDSVTTVKILDGAVTADKLSDMGAGVGQVLKFNGTSWVPGDLSSLTYAGNWDANTNSPDLSGGGSLGEFYIVSIAGSFNLAGGAGTNSWAVGDWAVWNNVVGQWEKIDNATNVQSFNGRSGAVSPATNDYTWAQIDKTTSTIGDIADVDLTGVTDGKILKYQSGAWIIADDLSSGGAGSVSSSEIADSTIVNADISASANIDQSKINGLPALASSVSTNTTDIATNVSNISSNDTDIATNATDIATNTSSISSLSTTVGTKAASATNLTAGDGLSGGGDLSTDRSFAVNVDDATIEIATDTLQVKNIPDTKLTTACADGEVLSASSGAFVCAASTTVGNWTESSGDLYYTLGNVGVGSSTLNYKLNVNENSGGGSYMQFTNTDSGNTSADGLVIGLSSSEVGVINVKETNHLDLQTDNTIRMRLTAAGDVGIGTTAPSSKLEVNGDITASNFIGDGSSLTNVSAISSSAVSASAGSMSAPSISFSGDTDTGFYSSAGNTIEVSVGGTNIFDLNAVGVVSPTVGGGVLLTGNGSVSTPTFSFAGDEDTGWYRAAANTLAASTGGSERMRIDSSGNVGIGVTSPEANLHVGSGSSILSGEFLVDNDAIYHGDSGYATNVYYLLVMKEDIEGEVSGRISGARTEGAGGRYLWADFVFSSSNSTYDNIVGELLRTNTTGITGSRISGWAEVVYNGSRWAALHINAGSDIHAMSWHYDGVANPAIRAESDWLTLVRADNVNLSVTTEYYRHLIDDQITAYDASDSTYGDAVRIHGDLDVDANIGLGTTNPLARIHLGPSQNIVMQTDQQTNGIIFHETGTVVGDGSSTSNGAKIYYNGTSDILKITSIQSSTEAGGVTIARATGNVGVGTDSPSSWSRLHVNGEIRGEIPHASAQNASTHGSTTTRGAWVASTLTATVPRDGTYMIMIHGRAFNLETANDNWWKMRLYHVTDVTTLTTIFGARNSNAGTDNGDGGASGSWMATLTAGDVLRLDYFISGSGTGTINFGNVDGGGAINMIRVSD